VQKALEDIHELPLLAGNYSPARGGLFQLQPCRPIGTAGLFQLPAVCLSVLDEKFLTEARNLLIGPQAAEWPPVNQLEGLLPFRPESIQPPQAEKADQRG
jgi:hypothetical protein